MSAMNRKRDSYNEDADDAYEEEESDEDLNLRMFGIQPALPLDGSDEDEGELDEAAAYLRSVRAEAASCPRVVRVEFDAETYAAKQRSRAAAAQHGRDASAQHDTAVTTAPLEQATKLGGIQEPIAPATSKHCKPSATKASSSTDAGVVPPPPLPRAPGYVSRLLAAGALAAGPEWSLPSRSWVRQVVMDFKGMRQWLTTASQQQSQHLRHHARLPPASDESAWDDICMGTRNLSMNDDTVQAHDRDDILQHSLHGVTAQHGNAEQEPPGAVPAEASSNQTTPTECGVDMGQGSMHQQPQEQASQAAKDDSLSQQAHASSTQHGSIMEEIRLPVLSTVLCIDQVEVGNLIQRMVVKLSDGCTLSDHPSQWLFALSAALEKPAHSDVVAAMRALTRWLRSLRSRLTEPSDPQLPRINTLLAVAGAYFGQDDELVSCVADLDLP